MIAILKALTLLSLFFSAQLLAQEAESSPTSTDGRPISIDLQDTDIENFLRIIAEVSNLNVVVVDAVSYTVTTRILDTPWKTVLRTILHERKLDFIEEGSLLRIYDAQSPQGKIPAAKSFNGRKLSLDLQDTSAEAALRVVQEIAGSPLPKIEKEGCQVTLRVIDIPWDQAFDLIRQICERQRHEGTTKQLATS